MAELAQDVKRLTLHGYPEAPYDMVETLAKDHFIDALQDTDIKWRVYQSRPASLSDAVVVAVELEAFHLAEIKKGNIRRPTVRVITQGDETSGEGEDPLQKLVETLSKSFENFLDKLEAKLSRNGTNLPPAPRKMSIGSGQGNQSGSKPSWQFEKRPPPKCWNCGKVGHIKRNCTEPRKEDKQNQNQDNSENYQESDLQAKARLQ